MTFQFIWQGLEVVAWEMNLDIRKKSTGRAVQHWHRSSREVVEYMSFEVFKTWPGRAPAALLYRWRESGFLREWLNEMIGRALSNHFGGSAIVNFVNK